MIVIGLKAAAKGREDEFPVLARALPNMEFAPNLHIEWPGGTNYMQIVRHPFSDGTAVDKPRDEERLAQKLTEHLGVIELILIYGIPEGPAPHRLGGTCGGYRHFLGRDELLPDDRLALRVLRDTKLFENRSEWGIAADFRHDELLTEFSLEVT